MTAEDDGVEVGVEDKFEDGDELCVEELRDDDGCVDVAEFDVEAGVRSVLWKRNCTPKPLTASTGPAVQATVVRPSAANVE